MNHWVYEIVAIKYCARIQNEIKTPFIEHALLRYTIKAHILMSSIYHVVRSLPRITYVGP